MPSGRSRCRDQRAEPGDERRRPAGRLGRGRSRTAARRRSRAGPQASTRSSQCAGPGFAPGFSRHSASLLSRSRARPLIARSAAASTVAGAISRRGSGNRPARTAADRTAGTAARQLDRLGRERRRPPGRRPRGQRRPVEADDRDRASCRRRAAARCRRRRRAPRASSSARSSAQVELDGVHDPVAGAARRRRRACAPIVSRRVAVRRAREQHARGAAVSAGGQAGEPATRTPRRASGGTGCPRSRGSRRPGWSRSASPAARSLASRRVPPPRGGRVAISVGSRSRSGGAKPSGASRSHWFTTECRGAELARPRHAVSVHPAAPADGVADPPRRAGRPRQQRAARGRRAGRSPRRSRRRAQPARQREVRARIARGRPGADATMTSSRCGLPATTGAACGSTRYARCASGNRRRSARMTGVVNTTSPISRRRIRRILTGWSSASVLDGRLVDQHDRDVCPRSPGRPGGTSGTSSRRRRGRCHRDVAGGADQNLEQLRIDGHASSFVSRNYIKSRPGPP